MTATDERNAINVDTAAIAKIDADILACRTSQDLLNKNIADNNRVIGRLELELKQYQSDIRQLSKLKQLKDKSAYVASNAGWLKKAFSKSGIPHNIIRSIIPVLQTTASNILGQMSNNTMSIELKTEKMLTTKKEVATLDIIVCDTVTGDLPYLSRSGGERFRSSWLLLKSNPAKAARSSASYSSMNRRSSIQTELTHTVTLLKQYSSVIPTSKSSPSHMTLK